VRILLALILGLVEIGHNLKRAESHKWSYKYIHCIMHFLKHDGY